MSNNNAMKNFGNKIFFKHTENHKQGLHTRAKKKIMVSFSFSISLHSIVLYTVCTQYQTTNTSYTKINHCFFFNFLFNFHSLRSMVINTVCTQYQTINTTTTA